MYANKDGLGFWRAFIIALMFQFFLFRMELLTTYYC